MTTTGQIMLHSLTQRFPLFTLASATKVVLPRSIVLLCLSLLITACANTDTSTDTSTEIKNTSDVFHQDSTIYFADKKASVSLRASFIQETSQESIETDGTVTAGVTTQSLINGYKLQFRTLLKGNNTLEQVSVIAGGKKIVLSDQSLFIQANKGLIINANKKDTLFIIEKGDATLRFKFNQTSYLMSIRNHTLSEFIIPL